MNIATGTGLNVAQRPEGLREDIRFYCFRLPSFSRLTDPEQKIVLITMRSCVQEALVEIGSTYNANTIIGNWTRFRDTDIGRVMGDYISTPSNVLGAMEGLRRQIWRDRFVGINESLIGVSNAISDLHENPLDLSDLSTYLSNRITESSKMQPSYWQNEMCFANRLYGFCSIDDHSETLSRLEHRLKLEMHEIDLEPEVAVVKEPISAPRIGEKADCTLNGHVQRTNGNGADSKHNIRNQHNDAEVGEKGGTRYSPGGERVKIQRKPL